MSFPLVQLVALLFSVATLSAQASDLADLERAANSPPSDVQAQRRLAAYETAGRRLDAVTAWTRVTELAPQAPSGWHALGLAYSALSQEAIGSFEDRAEAAVWRQLLIADGLLATGHLTDDAFAIHRSIEASCLDGDDPRLDCEIYERSGHAAWAARERKQGVVAPDACAARKALCEFRGDAIAVLDASLAGTDAESRYWRARAARELARATTRTSTRSPTRRSGARPARRSHGPRIGTRTQ